MQIERTHIAPGGLCKACGCACAGDEVTVKLEFDPILRRLLPTYQHATKEGCERARFQSAQFWGER